jgi:hypothetical protein
MNTFHCSHCDTKLSADPSDAGGYANCPTCGHELVVPENIAQATVGQIQPTSPLPNSLPTASEVSSEPLPNSDMPAFLSFFMANKWAFPVCLVMGLILLIVALDGPAKPRSNSETKADPDTIPPRPYPDYTQSNQSKPDLSKYLSSKEFRDGFLMGGMSWACPFGVSEAMSAGYEYGKKAQSLPAFTEGQNKGMEERRTGRNLKLNPYNRISQSFEHLTWETGYHRGNIIGEF